MIVTDAMDMQGLTKQFSPGEAAVRALEAGADILLMPREPEQALDGVMEAVRSGRLTEKRITDSARRMLQAKARVGLQAKKLVDIESITTTIEDPELAAEAQRALTGRSLFCATTVQCCRYAHPNNLASGSCRKAVTVGWPEVPRRGSSPVANCSGHGCLIH